MEERTSRPAALFTEDPARVQKVRDKFREVFECDVTLDDNVMMQRFSVTAEGDLVMRIR